MPALYYERKVQNLVESVRENEYISDRNKELILDFKRDLSLNGIGTAWLQNILSRLKVKLE